MKSSLPTAAAAQLLFQCHRQDQWLCHTHKTIHKKLCIFHEKKPICERKFGKRQITSDGELTFKCQCAAAVQDQWRKKEERVQAKALASQVKEELKLLFMLNLVRFIYVGMKLKMVRKILFFFHWDAWIWSILAKSRWMENLALVSATQSKLLKYWIFLTVDTSQFIRDKPSLIPILVRINEDAICSGSWRQRKQEGWRRGMRTKFDPSDKNFCVS